MARVELHITLHRQ